MSNELFHFIKTLLALTLLDISVYGNTHDPRVPESTFRCQDHEFPGYFADPETSCQVFHICVHRLTRYDQYSFLCPNQTAFDQKLLVCQWQDKVDCSLSSLFYDRNRRIYQDQEDLSDELRNDVGKTIRGVNRRGKTLPHNYIHGEQDSLVEAAIPEESRQPLDILSNLASPNNNPNLKTDRQNTDGPIVDFGKPFNISLKKQWKMKQQSNHSKISSDKHINIELSKLSNKKATDKVSTRGNLNSSKINLPKSVKIVFSKISKTSDNTKKMISSSGFAPGRILQNRQSAPSRFPPKASIANKSKTSSKINLGGIQLNRNIGKPLKKVTEATQNRKKLTQSQSRSQLLNTNVGSKSKLSNKRVNNFPRKIIKGKSEFKLNVPSSRPLPAGILANSLTPITKQSTARKPPILIISSAEADTNEENQKRVYLNRIKTTDSNIGAEVFGGKPLIVARTQKANREKQQKKITTLQGVRGVPASVKTSKKNSPRLKHNQPSKVSQSPLSRIKQSSRNQQPRADAQRTTFRDESLEEGKLGLIASSILKLRPRFF